MVKRIPSGNELPATRRGLKLFLALAALLLTLAGCGARRTSRRPRVTPPPASAATPSTARIVQGEEGIASWYGEPFNGRRTANGEIYNMYAISAAHKTLPFGTEVMVHNLRNGQRVQVRINDRGPFVEGRIIDLSYAAAQVIHMSGIAPVRLQILKLSVPPTPGRTRYSVQVGSFTLRRNAVELRNRLRRAFSPVFVETFDRGDRTFYRVRVGEVRSVARARQLERRLQRRQLKPFIVALD